MLCFKQCIDGCLQTLNMSRNLKVILLTLDKLEKNISHFTDFIQVKKISSFLAHEFLQRKKAFYQLNFRQ